MLKPKSKILSRYLPLTLAFFGVLAIVVGYFVLRSENPQAEAAWYNSSWGYRKPITIDKNKVVGGGTVIYSSDKVTGGTASGRDEANSPANEKPAKAADDSDSTKWLQFKTGGTPFWWQYDFGSGVAWKIAKYSLTTANDSTERDPKTWTLLASNTGSFSGEEVTIDTVSDGALSDSRGVTKEFTIASPPTTAYRYYRISISDLKNLAAANSTQVAEFRMYTLDSDGVTLTDFPMVVNVTDSDLKYTGSGGYVGTTNGQDILFTSSDGSTKLSHEIEKYSSSTGETIAWVKIPTLSSASDTVIYMYFGNSGASDQQAATSTWDSNYKGVWHLPNGTTLTAADSTTNNATPTITNATAATGQIGGGANFNGSTMGITATSSATNITGTNLTISFWMKPTVTNGSGSERLVSKAVASDADPFITYGMYRTGSAGTLNFAMSDGSTVGNLSAVTSTGAVTGGVWIFVTGTYDGTNVKIYLNGALDKTQAVTRTIGLGGSKPVGFGFDSEGGPGSYYNGLLDQIELSNTPRAAGWIATQYNNQFSPSTFYAYGKLGKETVTSFPASSAPAGPGWYNASWTYRKPITIDKNKVATSTNLTNFPLLVSVTDTDLKYTGSGGYVGTTNGQDILFTSSDGTTKLNHEIEKYSSTTGETIAWVQIPTLSNANDTQIFMYFGNSGASNQQAATSTWDSNFRSVWHSSETSGTALVDSTSNAINGTKLSSTEPNPTTSGKIGGADTYDGNNDNVIVSDTTDPTAYTISAWVKPTLTTNQGVFLRTDSGGPAGSYSHNIRINSSGQFENYLWDGGGQTVTGSSLASANNWYYVVGTATNSGSMRLYLNGIEEGTPDTLGTMWTGGDRYYIGSGWGGLSSFSGIIDEVRLSNTARTAGWIQTEYNNQNSPSTFYAYGKLGQQQANTVKIKSQGAAGPGWYNASWTNRKLITINPDQLSTSATTTFSNFPMLFNITDSDLKYTGSGGKVASSTGGDILFTASDGTTKLYHELEKYASTTGETIAWVQIPTLASTTSIYIYFGNSGASAQQAATSTWESNYKLVWHLPNGTTLTASDSTSNANTGTVSSATAAAGQIYGAGDFSGTSQEITRANTASIGVGAGDSTVSVWFKGDTYPGTEALFDKGASGSRDYAFFIASATSGHIAYGNAGGSSWTGSGFTLGAWHYLTIAQTGGTASVYLDGVLNFTKAVNVGANGSGTLSLGGNPSTGGVYFDGKLDEFRVQGDDRSADWIKTEYNNQVSPSTFFAISPLQANGRQDSSGNTVPTVKARGGVKFR